jgi:hypothetical protein
VLLIVVAVVAGVAAIGVVGTLIWRQRHTPEWVPMQRDPVGMNAPPAKSTAVPSKLPWLSAIAPTNKTIHHIMPDSDTGGRARQWPRRRGPRHAPLHDERGPRIRPPAVGWPRRSAGLAGPARDPGRTTGAGQTGGPPDAPIACASTLRPPALAISAVCFPFTWRSCWAPTCGG